MKKLPVKITCFVLLLSYFTLGMKNVRNASLTFDEGPHLAVGYTTVRTGDFRLQPVHIHPPLANILAGAPLLLQNDLPNPEEIDGWGHSSLSAITDSVIWKYPHPAHIATAGRVPMLLLGFLLAVLLYKWANQAGGQLAGILALTLYAFDPNIIAHSSLITTDITVTLFLTATLFVTNLYLFPAKQRPYHSYLPLIIGVFLGLALLSKVSALLLLPVIGVLIFCKELTVKRKFIPSLLQTTYEVLKITGIAIIVLWAGYGFEITNSTEFPFVIPAGTHFEIYNSLTEHYQLGHPTYALGKISTHGWWWYFPLAFLLKTPLPTLVILAVSVIRLLYDLVTKPLRQNVFLQSKYWVLTFWSLIYAFSSLFSSVNIGYRHLLPLLPCLYVFSSLIITHGYKTFTNFLNNQHRWLKPLLLLLLCCFGLWFVGGTWKVAHSPLEFFNELAGGSKGGYQYLVDSNIDWGQNLWTLRQWIEQSDVDQVKYAHYSPASPEQYDIQSVFLPPDPRAITFTPWHPESGTYVIGATILQGAYTSDPNTYAYFRAREPDARIGGALFIYNIDQRLKPSWVVSCDLEPTPDTIHRQLSDHTVRVIQIDCQQTQVFPTSEGTGFVITSPKGNVPISGSRYFNLKSNDGQLWRTVYRIETSPKPSTPMQTLINGPLDFIGYSLDYDTLGPGGMVKLQTTWRVNDIPGRPLSLLAQMIPPSGPAYAVGDGLGFPIEAWSPGDMIIQTHILQVPDTIPIGQPVILITGGYWLDTMERWETEHKDDIIVLSELVVED